MQTPLQPPRAVYGRSAAGRPLELIKAGCREKTVVFSESFSGDARISRILLRFAGDLFSSQPPAKSPDYPALMLRTAVIVPDANPDLSVLNDLKELRGASAQKEARGEKAEDPTFLAQYERARSVGRNFNHAFSGIAGREKVKVSPAGAPLPESAPESAAFASALRSLCPRLLAVIGAGSGYAVPVQREERWLRALVRKHAPFEETLCDFSGSPEGWYISERGGAALHIGVPEMMLAAGTERAYALLKPLFSALLSF